MPFDDKTRRGNFGKQGPAIPVPPENRPQGWNEPLYGASVPLSTDQSSNSDTRLKIGAVALTTSLIALPIAFIALADSDYTRTSQGCVDEKGVVVEDYHCRSGSSGGHFYRHHYGGSYRIGSYPTGGTYTAPPASGTVRGFFGSIGHSLGAGG